MPEGPFQEIVHSGGTWRNFGRGIWFVYDGEGKWSPVNMVLVPADVLAATRLST